MKNFYTENEMISSVQVGRESSLPSLESLCNIQQRAWARLDENDEVYVGYGFCDSIFPYRQQDDYDRRLKEHTYKSIVLENDYLRARFLPELGGRLISLIDKESGKELLYRGKDLYVGNLAIRNSWFAGGVEWNVSVIGHNPFTCSSLFAARLELPDGTPVLRMYEYERLRGVTYQMDFFLPEDSRVLMARMRLVNENPETVPTYWWSNIAVPEWQKGRVVVPADSAYVVRDRVIVKESVPVDDLGVNVTYPVKNPTAIDHFWKIPPDSRKYIAHVDESGWGLVQTSTSRQRGRKLFVWGQSKGASRWQEFLSGNKKDRYIEIQAGLAQTQYECVPMPPRTAWEWMEAYGAINTDPGKVHGSWSEARTEVEEQLGRIVSQEKLEILLEETRSFPAKQQAHTLICQGSGWGALENIRRKKEGLPPLSAHLDFGTPKEPQDQWISLLEQGTLGLHYSGDIPPSWMGQEYYIHLMKQAAEKGSGDWYLYLQLGVSLLARGEYQEAENALEQSLALEQSAWGCYALCCLYQKTGEHRKACCCAGRAIRMRREDVCVVKRCLAVLIEQEEYEEALAIIEELPQNIRQAGRVCLYEARALTGLRRLDEAEYLLKKNGGLIVPDMREGEVSTSELWIELQSKKLGVPGEEAERLIPVPDFLDFRTE